MIVVVNAENRRLFESDLVDMHRQRKTVFVDGAGWRIAVIGNMEVDEYDRPDTIYLLAKDSADGPLLAPVRLLTTTGPHLMCDLFQADNRTGIPRGPAVWEVSRFCTAPGPRYRDGDEEASAVVAATTPESLRGVRRRHRVPIPVTRFHANSARPTRLDPTGNPPATAGSRTRLTHSAWRNRWREYPLSPGAPRHG